MTAATDEPVGVDTERLSCWLRSTIEPELTSVAAERIGGGNSSGAWRLDVTTTAGLRALVLKAPDEGGLVYACDATREGRILTAARQAGAPVPAVVAIEESGDVL